MTIVGTYPLHVAPGAWTCGPTFRLGESVRVQASGIVRWIRPADETQTFLPVVSTEQRQDYFTHDNESWLAIDSAGNQYPLLSSQGQAIFAACVSGVGGGYLHLPAGSPAGRLTVQFGTAGDAFGTQSDGRAEFVARSPSSSTLTVRTDHANGGGDTADSGVTATYSAAVCPVHYNAGSHLTASCTVPAGVGLDVDRIRLVAGAAPTPGGYAYPEGTYPPDFDALGYGSLYRATYPRSYDPLAVLQPGDWTGGPLLAPGLPPLGLVMRAFPDGTVPPFASTPGCAAPGRLRTFSPADLVAAGAIDEEIRYRLWFGVDDALDATSDTGGYSLLVDRLLDPKPMALPLESLVAPRLGRQTALATRVPVTRMLGCIADKGLKIKPEQTWEDSGTAGIGYNTGSDLIYDVSSGDVTLNVDTLDTGYLLYALCGGETVTSPGAGVYDHVFTFPVFAQAIPPKHSLELPTQDGEMVQRTIDVIFNGLKLGTDPKKLPTCSTALIGGKLVVPEDADLALAYNGSNTGALTPGQNAVQTVTVVGAPTGGSYVLYDEYTQTPSGTINVGDAASAIQTAVRVMGGAWAAAVVAGTASSYTVTSPTGKRLAKLEALFTGAGGTSTLTGGTTPSVTVAYTNPGGFPITPTARCLAQSWVLSLAPNWTAMENAPVQLSDGFASDVTIAERWDRKWIQGAAPGIFDYTQKEGKGIKDTMSLEMAFMPQVRQFINSSRSGSRMAARLQSNGAAIASTGLNRFLRVDMDGQAKWPDVSDSDNVRSIKVDIDALYNLANGQFIRIVLRNEVPSYATM